MSSAEAGAAARPAQKVGVVLVHGVGETELGHTVNTLVASLVAAEPGYSPVPHSEVMRLPDVEAPRPAAAKGAETAPEFRVVRRRVTHADGTDVVFDELHWADLTHLKAGRFNALMGMIRVVFESHHIVNAMLDGGRDMLTGMLRRLLLIASWLMRGPLAALTISTSAICAVLMFGPVTGPVGSMDVSSKFQAVQIVLLAAAFGLLGLVAWARDVSWYDTVFWLIIVAGAVLLLERTSKLPDAVQSVPIVSSTIGAHCFKNVERDDEAQTRSLKSAYRDTGEIRRAQADGCYINGPYRVIAYGWRLWGALMVGAIVLLLIMHMRARSPGEKAGLAPAATSIGIVILQFVMWTLLAVTTIFPMLNRAEAVQDLMAVRQELMGKVDLGKGAIAKMMQFPAVDLDWIGRFKFVYGAAATTLVGFLAIVLVISARRSWVAWRFRNDYAEADQRMPALLFNGWLLAWLMLAVLSVIAFIMVTKTPEHAAFETVKTVMLVVAAGAAALVPMLLLEQVSNGVHIARDFIDHHFDPELDAGTRMFSRTFSTRSRFPRRTRIAARLESVVERLGRDGPFDRIILAGHSQGSVVVFDYILQRSPYVAALAREKPMLLTLGSPLSSLYRKYFHEYRTVATPEWLEGRLSRWVNLYRLDDYVGGRIADCEGVGIENVPMKAGGHMRYWSSPKVAKALDGMVRGAG